MARAKLIFQQVMPNFNFDTVMAKTNIDDQAYQQLVNHEKTAIKRDLANFNAGNAWDRMTINNRIRATQG